jgi:hypothetical protein
MSLPIHIFNAPIYTAQDMSLTSTSSIMNIMEAKGYCIQALYTGAPVGTLQVQGSNDGVNFINVPGSQFTVAVSAAGESLITDPTPFYAFVQLVYTFTSGTGSLSALINAKR